MFTSLSEQSYQTPDSCFPDFLGDPSQGSWANMGLGALIGRFAQTANASQMLQGSWKNETAEKYSAFVTYALKELRTKQAEVALDQDAAKVLKPKRIERGPATLEIANVIPESIVSCWNLLRQSGFSDETFGQIVSVTSNRLLRANQGLRPLNTKTLTAFLNFWRLCGDEAADPEVMISPKGNFQAEWWKDSGNFIVMEFQPNSDIYFSLWQDNYPLEGSQAAKKMHELVHIFGAMDENPLGWSDVA